MTPEEYAKLTEGQKATQSRITQAQSVSLKINGLKKIIESLSNPVEMHEHSAIQMTVYSSTGGIKHGFSVSRDEAVHFRHVFECEILPRLEAEYEQI